MKMHKRMDINSRFKKIYSSIFLAILVKINEAISIFMHICLLNDPLKTHYVYININKDIKILNL